MQSVNNTVNVNSKFSADVLRRFAALAVASPNVAMATLRGLADPGDLIDGLAGHPGALAALYNSDECPRALKGFLADALEVTGHKMLT